MNNFISIKLKAEQTGQIPQLLKLTQQVILKSLSDGSSNWISRLKDFK